VKVEIRRIWFEARLAKRFGRPSDKLGMAAYTCHPIYMGSVNGKNAIQTGPAINRRHHLNNN
jgi:hypothetical protein